MEKRLKDEDLLYATIKIRRIREVKKTDNSWEYKDKLYCIDIRHPFGRGVSFCETTLRKAFKKIKEFCL